MVGYVLFPGITLNLKCDLAMQLTGSELKKKNVRQEKDQQTQQEKIKDIM